MNNQSFNDLSVTNLFAKALEQKKTQLSDNEIIEMINFFSKVFRDKEINVEKEINNLLEVLG